MSAGRWGKRAGKIVLVLLLAELLFFFFVGLRLRKQFEGQRQILGVVERAGPCSRLASAL